MAGALIGEAFISASIQVICYRIASPKFVDLFRHKKLDQPLLMKLKRTLLTLNAVLDDAEEKQIEKPAVREWLDDLKHAVFDAEDLLDEINYEALRCKLEGEAQTADKLTNKVSFKSLHARGEFTIVYGFLFFYKQIAAKKGKEMFSRWCSSKEMFSI